MKYLIALALFGATPAHAQVEIEIDLSEQMLYVYDNGELREEIPVSTGKTGKETPTGEFTVERKVRDYWSRKYKAPMPHSQFFISKWGIAFHGGDLPGYPASSGCVRLPYSAAKRLFSLTKIGTPVKVVE